MDGGSPDTDGPKVPYEETNEGRARKEELTKRRDAKLQLLRETGKEETADKIEELGSLLTRKEKLNPDEIQRKNQLTEQLTQEAEQDPELNNIVASYILDDITDDVLDDGEGPDASDKEVEEFGEKVEDLQREARDLLFSADGKDAKERAEALLNEIGSIANNGEMLKIKRSQSLAARSAYAAWMTFLMIFGLFLFTAKTVSKPFAGGKK